MNSRARSLDALLEVRRATALAPSERPPPGRRRAGSGGVPHGTDAGVARPYDDDVAGYLSAAEIPADGLPTHLSGGHTLITWYRWSARLLIVVGTGLVLWLVAHLLVTAAHRREYDVKLENRRASAATEPERFIVRAERIS